MPAFRTAFFRPTSDKPSSAATDRMGADQTRLNISLRVNFLAVIVAQIDVGADPCILRRPAA